MNTHVYTMQHTYVVHVDRCIAILHMDGSRAHVVGVGGLALGVVPESTDISSEVEAVPLADVDLDLIGQQKMCLLIQLDDYRLVTPTIIHARVVDPSSHPPSLHPSAPTVPHMQAVRPPRMDTSDASDPESSK